jgi:D-arabinose 1-dehydrogenase-like Zn-dependent alcohol dehydrogenase
VFSRELEIHGTYIGTRAELEQILPYMVHERLRPIVDSIYDLRDARAAHERLESRDFFGKIVLRIP